MGIVPDLTAGVAVEKSHDIRREKKNIRTKIKSIQRKWSNFETKYKPS